MLQEVFKLSACGQLGGQSTLIDRSDLLPKSHSRDRETAVRLRECSWQLRVFLGEENRACGCLPLTLCGSDTTKPLCVVCRKRSAPASVNETLEMIFVLYIDIFKVSKVTKLK